jgi:hypothetical protein
MSVFFRQISAVAATVASLHRFANESIFFASFERDTFPVSALHREK